MPPDREKPMRSRLLRGQSVFATGALLAVLADAGCASHHKYPRSWPVLADRSQACEYVAGGYRNQGERSETLTPSWLTTLLFGDGSRNQVDSVRVSLASTTGLEVELVTGGESTSLFVPKNRVKCEGGLLIIETGGRWVGRANQYAWFAAGRRSTSLELASVSNWLVVKEKAHTLGVMTGIPWRYSAENWHRFARLAEN